MKKVHLKTLAATTEPLPLFLIGLEQESLNDLSWTDETLGVSEYGFWQEVDATPPFDNLSTYDGTEVLTADAVTITVNVVRGVRLKTDAELLTEFKSTVPTQITKLQAMRAMKTVATPNGTLWVDFNNALATNTDAMDEWNLSPVLLRSNVYVAQLALYLGITERQLDELFILGASL
ncbi:MAG: hypothetical protein NTW78_06050 [Campylobacterales bacterium]|nr:hypothetical protein [Campylobacterales bacterium]